MILLRWRPGRYCWFRYILQGKGVCFWLWLGYGAHNSFPSLICLASCICSRRTGRWDNIARCCWTALPYLHTRILGLLQRNLIAAWPGSALLLLFVYRNGGGERLHFSVFIYHQHAWLDNAHQWVGGGRKLRLGFDGIEEAYNELTSK